METVIGAKDPIPTNLGEVKVRITKELHKYYHETGLGNWNLMYFKVLVEEERFTVDFEKNDQLASDELSLYEYCDKLR